MSNNKEHNKQKKNDHLFTNFPTEVLLKARSTISSLSEALKPKHEQQQKVKPNKQESREKKSQEKLKSSRSEPEFSEIRKIKHRSRIEDGVSREYTGGLRPRPLSVGAIKRYEQEMNEFICGNFTQEYSPLRRNFDSAEEVCVQSRLVIPVTERLNDVQMQDVSERPRKKLSFREPEIVNGSSATLGRSHKLMGINSLTRRPNRVSLRSDLEGLDSELESQAMMIVRTVGQAFEVCHKMQTNSPEEPAPSTSSAPDEAAVTDQASDIAPSKETVSECAASESGQASTSKAEEGAVGGKQGPTRPQHLELLPPPPRKEGKRTQQRTTPTPSINLPDLPECITKVELTTAPNVVDDTTTPLTAQHELQLLRERLEQQVQQTQAAVAQMMLLRNQLAAEQAARCDAQARTHQLLLHNKELLEHIAALVAHLQERERGVSRPINAQQLTLLPQAKTHTIPEIIKPDNAAIHNGTQLQNNPEAFINLISQTNQGTQNVENNNLRNSPFCVSPVSEATNGSTSAPCFSGMTNEQIQNYLTSKFQDMGGSPNETKNNNNYNQYFYQNSRAFPNIPPLTNHYSNTDLASLMKHTVYKDLFSSTEELSNMVQNMSICQSDNSLYSNNSQATTSKDSSPDSSSNDGVAFIMPLSHKATLKATDEEGRVRLIVPVSPSESNSDVVDARNEPQASTSTTLKVPSSNSLLAPSVPITRSTSEKVPNRSEMMKALRSQWTRHTTK